MLIGARTAAWGGKAGIVPVEYIATCGVSGYWIDTGITARNTLSINIEFSRTNTETAHWPFGSRVGAGDRCFGYVCADSGQEIWQIGNKAIRTVAAGSITNYSLGMSNYSCYVNATPYGSANSQSFTSSVNIYLFNINLNGTPSAANCLYGRMMSCIIRDSGTVLRDYIPVKFNGVGYMFDRQNPTGGPLGNGLYGNSGSGLFEIGPEVS